MVLTQMIALLALKRLFWMQTLASVMTTIILIFQMQHTVTKELVNNVQSIKEMTRDYQLLAIYVTLNGYFSFFFFHTIKYWMLWDCLQLMQ